MVIGVSAGVLFDSPPFIPAPVAGETDDAYLARAMVGGIPGDGGYPLSFDLNWHGGIHLTAPQEGGIRCL